MEYWTTGRKLIAAGFTLLIGICSAAAYTYQIKQPIQIDSSAATAQQDPGAQWIYVYMPLPGGDRRKHLAGVMSDNQVGFKPPYQGAQKAWLILRNHPQQGKSAMLNIEKGKFACEVHSSCQLSLRFDDGEQVKVDATANPEKNGNSLVISHYGEFLNKLKHAHSLEIDAPVVDQQTANFHFNVADLVSTDFDM